MSKWNSLNRVLVISTALFCNAALAAQAADSPVVSFRLTKQKSVHFDAAAKAKRHYDTLRKLGCDVKQAAHGDHFDVVYSAPSWKKLKFKSFREADQWTHWLARSGFELVHIKPPASGHLEIVAYRLSRARSQHHESSAKAKEQADTLRMLGCEVKQEKHAGHFDVSYRCDEWQTVGFESDEVAHQWQKWLKSTGFETTHKHSKQAKKTTTRR
jgi:hypothetical protein